MKQTKSAKFRGLYLKIEELLKLYTYEGVIEILKEEHGLDLSEKTFTLYLYRARKANSDKNYSSGKALPIQQNLNSVAKTLTEKSTDQMAKLPSLNSKSVHEDEEVSEAVINEMLAELNTEKKNLQKKTIFNK